MEIKKQTNNVDSNATQKQNLKDALCEVRKAHRLIYSYQKHMLSLIRFLRSRLGFSDVNAGYRYFSDPIFRWQESPYRLKVYENSWAWDFLYSYVFEYDCNEVELDDNSTITLSIVQYSDTGHYENSSGEDVEEPNPEDFSPVNKSGTKLLFIMERIPSRCKRYLDEETTKKLINTPEYASMAFNKKVIYPKGERKNQILLYSVPLEEFVDEESTLKILHDYLKFLKKNDIELELL